MGTIEKSPLLSPNEVNDFSEKELSRDNNSSGKSKLQIVAGFLAVLGWLICCAVSAICIQLLERRIPDFQLNLARMLLTWIGGVIILLITRRIPTIPREIIPWVVAAIIVQNAQSTVHYIGVEFISLVSFQCTVVTVTLISGIVIHSCMNNDRLHVTNLIAICVCILGICYVTQPAFLHPVLGLEKTQQYVIHQSANMLPPKLQHVSNQHDQTWNTTAYTERNGTAIHDTNGKNTGHPCKQELVS